MGLEKIPSKIKEALKENEVNFSDKKSLNKSLKERLNKEEIGYKIEDSNKL